jgi:hypothetical protein
MAVLGGCTEGGEMRTILILSILLGLGTGALAATESAIPATSAITCSVHSSPGSTILTVHNGSSAPMSGPVLRLIALPPGATEPRVRLLGTGDTEDPGVEVTAGSPMRMRGLTLLPVTIASKSEGKGMSAPLPRTVEVDVRYQENAGEGARSRALTHSRGFFDALTGMFPIEQLSVPSSVDEGTYLIISDPQFLTAVQPLADWKRQKGLDVIVKSTDDIPNGATNTGILAYITDQYFNAPKPPEYVVLVGDVPKAGFAGGIPSWDYHQATSDTPYALVDGDDFIPDLFLGRLSVRTLDDAQTVVAKIIGYEQAPTQGGSDWFSRGLVVAGNYGSDTPVPVCMWFKKELQLMGYTAVDSVYYDPVHHFNNWYGEAPIRASLTQGASIVAYRGWAYGVKGWQPPQFISEDIGTVPNTWKLPVFFSFVCETGDFGYVDEDCFGENLLRAGSPSAPIGAVAFIGNTEPWSHTRFNDAAAIGAMKMLSGGTRRLGEILNGFKLEWLLEFPTEIPFTGQGQESVEFYYHIYNLLGDPEMSIWTAPPQAIDVTYASPIPLGSNYLDVMVKRAGSPEPVEGVRVGITLGGVLLGTGRTDASGLAHVIASFESTDQPVHIVVTDAGVAPYVADVPVTQGEFLSLASSTIDDDNAGSSSGNGDHIPNPAERIEITPRLLNRGATTATGVQATLTSLTADSLVVSGQVSFPDIPAGLSGSSTQPFVVRIPQDARDRMALHFLVNAISGGGQSVSDLELAVQAPDLQHAASTVDGDGYLSPGETAALTLTLLNSGSIASETGTIATLRSRSPELVTVPDSSATYASLEPGSSGVGDHPFTVHADPEAGVGQVANFTLTLRSPNGHITSTSFGFAIGSIDHSAPLGPDGYGYYAYDNTDTDYPDAAPTFGYFTCSSAYGGPGQALHISDNTTAILSLPFQFTYYGQTYSSLAVSDNGWISFDTAPNNDFYNFHIPSAYGCGARIAPFWDNLDPLTLSGDHQWRSLLKADGIYAYPDSANHKFIVEWSALPNFNRKFSDLQTFEVVLYDPAYYQTQSGNGIIDFQYKQITNNDTDRMFATVGIEDATRTVGLEYSYSNLYPGPAAPIGAGLAIRLTTDKPRFRPFALARFQADPEGRGVQLTWDPADSRPRGGTFVYRGTVGGSYRRLNTTALDPSSRNFLDALATPDSSYMYKIGSTDPFGRETVVGPFAYTGRTAGPRLALEARTPNPFRGSLDLTYAIPRKGNATVRIHDLSGRLVRTLADAAMDAGIYSVTWDGRDEQGRDLPSGVYLCRLQAGHERRSLKLTLLR